MNKKIFLQITYLILFVAMLIETLYLDVPPAVRGFLGIGTLCNLVCFYMITKHTQ
ncbi:hypothetical protein QO009_000297 [Brevibacillus aydinogluensis]|jgi:hypothetical protein|uniref:Uncharacterized protein n=1 Tax=Brevibacillus aydinogluensis TaxID=927786 RepID=A0AA48MB96_9BACL|nr:hypothetical protein [Brevibacillus aydinogluensis]CAJ1003324.1 hypothetical protein BSPP4475_13480 [Brevibacillus aydinogluensis]